MTDDPGTVSSMTGFARREGRGGDDEAPVAWVWEAKSVNGKGLDLRARLPSGYEALEPEIRAAAAARFKRGALNIILSVEEPPRPLRVRINREVLDQLVAELRDVQADGLAPATLDGLLGAPGVLERVDRRAGDEDLETRRQALQAAMLSDLAGLFNGLRAARRAEGEKLGALMQTHLSTIAGLAGQASIAEGAQPAAFKARLKQQLETLLQASAGLSQERLAQEAALLATKADIQEEIDRLRAHIDQARALLASGEPVGRRLDFLCQEFNREANTLCSKAPDLEITNIGLSLKAAIEQMREQVQNIE